MKKWILAAAFALCGSALFAQEDHRWDVGVSAAFAGNYVMNNIGEGFGTALAQVFATIFTFGLYTPSAEYEHQTDNTLPALAIHGGYQALPWLRVTTDIFYHNSTRTYFVKVTDPSPAKIANGNRITILPGAKFTYLNKGVFHMYSSVALGAALDIRRLRETKADTETGDPVTSDVTTPRARFALQTTPVGFAVGRAFYGFLDFGIGSEYTGFRAGIGYSF